MSDGSTVVIIVAGVTVDVVLGVVVVEVIWFKSDALARIEATVLEAAAFSSSVAFVKFAAILLSREAGNNVECLQLWVK